MTLLKHKYIAQSAKIQKMILTNKTSKQDLKSQPLIPRRESNAADALSWDWHHSNDELTKILCSHFPKQMPANFEILLLPSVINLCLIFTLQLLPANALLQERHTMTGLKLGGGGSNIKNLLDVMAFTWMALLDKCKFSCLARLPWLSDLADFWGRSTTLCPKAQSEVPSHRLSGRRAH
jgi:hypothetical protein